MTLTFAVPMQSGDKQILDQLNEYCNQYQINLLIAEGVGYYSLLFTGNDQAIQQLKAYLDKR